MPVARQLMNRHDVQLPAPPQALGAYATAVRHGDLLFLSGMLPIQDGQPAVVGNLGNDLGVTNGRDAAAIAALNGLAVAQAFLGSLDRIESVIRLTVNIAAVPEFT